jgi:hypothetical protein
MCKHSPLVLRLGSYCIGSLTSADFRYNLPGYALRCVHIQQNDRRIAAPDDMSETSTENMRGVELVLSDGTWTRGRMTQAYSIVRYEDGRANAVYAHVISRTTREHAPFRAAVTPSFQAAEMELRAGRERKKKHGPLYPYRLK